jgi:ankyrin repeat protein
MDILKQQVAHMTDADKDKLLMVALNSFIDTDSSLEDTKSTTCTLLMIATRLNKKKIVTLLLDRGADINANDCNGFTVLMNYVDTQERVWSRIF